MCRKNSTGNVKNIFEKKEINFLTIIFDLFFKNAPPLEKRQYLKLQQREERSK